MKPKKVVGIYIRVSTYKQVENGFSLDAQLEEGTKEAHRKFGQDILIESYVDGGISGKNTKDRPALNRMMRDVAEGNIDAIITYKVSRLSRSLSDSLKIVEEIHKEKVKFISIKEGEYGTPHGNLQFNILVSVAQYQREDVAENVQFGMSQRAREGKWNGGQLLGYDTVSKELIINEEEAETIKLIFDKYVREGWGTKKISNHLNEIGKRTKKGKTFSIVSVSTILDNPAYKGYTRYNQVIGWETNRRKGKNPDYILTKGIHERIIDEETWDKAAELREKRRTGTPRQYSGSFPLTSLAKCPECGSYMTSQYGSKRKDGTKKRYYVCGQYHNKGRSVCNPNTIDAAWLEKAVFDRLTKSLQSDSVIKDITERMNKQLEKHPKYAEQSKEVKILQNQLTKLEANKKRIQDSVETGSGIYTEEEAIARINGIRTEINEIQNKIFTLIEKQPKNSTSIKQVTPELIRQQLQEFLDLSTYLEPMQFRELLVASIEKIEAEKKSLKHIHFSFIAHMPEEESSNSIPSFIKHIIRENKLYNKRIPLIIKGLYFKPIRYLFMVRFPPINPKRPINLLHQHQPHQLMRKCHLRKRQRKITSIRYFLTQA
ncbi:recombinase family protein [Radiobacillus deserti]|uniref:Recombinase family protein n=1 Tax=Radiobacillus deserti TaxID=2594883 RepID=A0A516KKS4_9BACI|nr:recombinase family protein [Radiobacillus deserti]